MLHKRAIYRVWRAIIIGSFHHLYQGFCWKATNIWLSMSSLTLDMVSWPTTRFGATMVAKTLLSLSSRILWARGSTSRTVCPSKLYYCGSQSFRLFMRMKLWITTQTTGIITYFSIENSGASRRSLNLFFKTLKVLSTHVLREECV